MCNRDVLIVAFCMKWLFAFRASPPKIRQPNAIIAIGSNSKPFGCFKTDGTAVHDWLGWSYCRKVTSHHKMAFPPPDFFAYLARTSAEMAQKICKTPRYKARCKSCSNVYRGAQEAMHCMCVDSGDADGLQFRGICASCLETKDSFKIDQDDNCFLTDLGMEIVKKRKCKLVRQKQQSDEDVIAMMPSAL
jgi:hypothetical protein